ncbi:MAG: hypothetical protein NTV34_01980 [Proteobacteria bacterium]|nr:hypothetical protein [Pseudomonadota bacterium]
MKAFALITLATLVVTPSAYAKTVATYSFGEIVNSDEGSNLHSVTVKLDSNQTLQINETVYAGEVPYGSLESQRNEILTLAPTVYARILTQLIQLSTAEIKTTHQTMVCKMMPPPGGPETLRTATDYDSQSRTFNGAMRTVLTREGCYLSSHTLPVEEYRHQDA